MWITLNVEVGLTCLGAIYQFDKGPGMTFSMDPGQTFSQSECGLAQSLDTRS